MQARSWLDRRSISSFVVGAGTAALVTSGVAVAAQVSLVQVVNAVLAVDVVNTDPIAVDIGTPTVDVGNAPVRTPFQWYGSVLSAGVDLATVPAGQRLVITHINADAAADTDFLSIFVDSPVAGVNTDRFWWDFPAETYLNLEVLIYADAGETVEIFEGSFLPAQPNVAVTGYYETI